MFSGLVEASTPVLSFQQMDQFIFRLELKRPKFFTDLKIGDSIATNGVCLSLVDLSEKTLAFDVGKETLEITTWTSQSLATGTLVNLERSLKLGDRLHGHFLSGHVDELGSVELVDPLDDSSLKLGISLGEGAQGLVWKKASIGINGVSLTVNECKQRYIEVGLIPETLNITNLKGLKVGDSVNIEYDWMAKAMWHQNKEMQHNISNSSSQPSSAGEGVLGQSMMQERKL